MFAVAIKCSKTEGNSGSKVTGRTVRTTQNKFANPDLSPRWPELSPRPCQLLEMPCLSSIN